jgi:hypothetical protein
MGIAVRLQSVANTVLGRAKPGGRGGGKCLLSAAKDALTASHSQEDWRRAGDFAEAAWQGARGIGASPIETQEYSVLPWLLSTLPPPVFAAAHNLAFPTIRPAREGPWIAKLYGLPGNPIKKS